MLSAPYSLSLNLCYFWFKNGNLGEELFKANILNV